MSLDRIISIERRTTTRDRFGGTIATWTEVDKVWGELRPGLKAVERYVKGSNRNQATRRAT